MYDLIGVSAEDKILKQSVFCIKPGPLIGSGLHFFYLRRSEVVFTKKIHCFFKLLFYFGKVNVVVIENFHLRFFLQLFDLNTTAH